ncbi:hypothetical protein ABLE68_03195 [Nocardioides sp. CN2-186]|uniref:hypothetical protein n=1 Tax=Nocardioides tweenelious TaxID=3156607 RepID=UPI0032B41FC8
MTDETRLTDELTRRAERVHAAPLSFESVRGRAQTIRRRRRAAAATGVAAAVAAVVLLPAVLSGGSDRSAPDPAPPAPAPPGSSVLHDGVVTLPDGSTVPVDVDNADVSQMGVLTDGRIVLALAQPQSIRVYGADGSLDDTYPAFANEITVSADDGAVAWVAKDRTVRVLTSGTAEPATLPGIPLQNQTSGNIDAVLDAEHLLVGDGSTTNGLLTSTGIEDLRTSEDLRVQDVSPDGDLWAVSYAAPEDPQFGCSGLYDPGAQTMVARSCDTSGLRFSPDGQHLLGMRGDNNMYGEVSTFDLDLEQVGTFTPTGKTAVVSRAGWADATHLLVGVTDWKLGLADVDTNPWSLVRVGLGGEDPEVVTPEGPGRNPEFVAEFVVSE